MEYRLRPIGPVNPMPRQPIVGRNLGNGLRLGEMDRDEMYNRLIAQMAIGNMTNVRNLNDFHRRGYPKPQV